MKRLLSLVCEAALTTGAAVAWAQSTQPKPYKVVFDLTTDDPLLAGHRRSLVGVDNVARLAVSWCRHSQ
jgi:hypothetical protein